MDDDMDSNTTAAAEAVENQLWLLRAKMLDYLGPDLGTEEDELSLGYAYDPGTGGTVVGISIDGLTYSLSNDQLIVQRERGGRVEYGRVARAGEPQAWQVLGPPPGKAAQN